jgi:hypothetical protein
MKKLLSVGVCAGMLLLSFQAFSQDSSTKPQNGAATSSMSNHHQMMKDCMSAEQAKNTGASKAELTKTCKAQVKMKEDQMKASGTDKDNTSK